MKGCCNITRQLDADPVVDGVSVFFRHHHHHHHHHRNNNCINRPLVLVSSDPRNGQKNVSPYIKAIKLIFGRNYDNDENLANAFIEIDMWQGMNKVPIRIRRGKNRIDGQRVILVIPINPLLGGETYKVRVKSFFVDNDCNTIQKINLIVFTTRCR